MTTRIVEWKKPYTWGTAIEIDENKVISLRLRDENNLIIYDAWDNEIYVDLQLPDWIRPLDAFPVGVTTGRVLVADDWDKTGTIICAKTTSGDNIKVLYADDWTLWIDNWTWIFKQIYFKADVDLIIQAIQNQIDALSGLGKFLSLWDWETWMPISFPLSTPYEYHTWDWYMINVVDNTTNYRPNWTEFDGTASSTVETQATEIWDVYIYDWSTWLLQKNGGWWGSAVLFSQVLWDPYSNTNLATALNAKQDELTAGTNIQISNNVISATWWSDIVYATQAEYNALLPWALTDWKHYFIYSTSGGWGWQPWVNTLLYYSFDNQNLNDGSGKWNNWTWYSTAWTYTTWISSYGADVSNNAAITLPVKLPTWDMTFSICANVTVNSWVLQSFLWVDWWSRAGQIAFSINGVHGIDLLIHEWGNVTSLVTNTTPTTNTWFNVMFTRSGNVWTVYYNWTSVGTATSSQSPSQNITYYISRNYDNNRYIRWVIDEVIIENRAWTQQEITDYVASLWIS